MTGCLIRWREGVLEVAQDVIEYNCQLLRDLVRRETVQSELSHVPTNLIGGGDNVAERASEFIDLLHHVKLACGRIEPLVGCFQESI